MLYQLSYAPGLRVAVYPRPFRPIRGGQAVGMTEYSTDEPVESGALEDDGDEGDDLLEEQEETGYGMDEGEREESLPE